MRTYDGPRSPQRPFLASEFDDTCEGCGAPPGAYCRPNCDSGYTAEDARAHAALLSRRPPGLA
ncbi:hypothetical protein PYK79_10285 [Streptomyces sp. ID05-04B]|nr:hypothetical protein [Streptomyces sp. ID05-04B]